MSNNKSDEKCIKKLNDGEPIYIKINLGKLKWKIIAGDDTYELLIQKLREKGFEVEVDEEYHCA